MFDRPPPEAALDVEVFPNWYYVLCCDREGNEVYSLECWDGEPAVTTGKMPTSIITYNGASFDIPVCSMIRAGGTVKGVARLTRDLISHQVSPHRLLKNRAVRLWRPRAHIDVMQTRNYLPVGLKLRAARLHHPKMELLPADPEKPITREQAETIKSYCANDCAATWVCYDDAQDFIESLAALPAPRPLETSPTASAEYIWKQKAKHRRRVEIAPVTILRTPFSHRDPALKAIQDTMETFSPEQKPVLFTLHGLDCRIGSGGIHTCERAVVADDLMFADASSYYARLMIGVDREHAQVPDFPGEIRALLQARLDYESKKGRAGPQDSSDRTTAKLLLSSASGKLNSEHSVLYDNSYYLSTTRSSASLMLDLAARVQATGAKVYSINTDGIVCDNRHGVAEAMDAWEEATTIPLDRKIVAKYRARDISSYIATDTEGKIAKRIGAFYGRSRNANPGGPIIADAAGQAVLLYDRWADAFDYIRQIVENASHPSDFAYVRQSKSMITAGRHRIPVGKLVRFAVAALSPYTTSLHAGGKKFPMGQRVILMPDYATFDINLVDRSHYVAEAISLWEAVHAKGPLL